MGKRSEYERKERDFYPTPLEAFLPILPHLPYNFTYIEPCAGDGELIKHMEKYCSGGKLLHASDIEPQNDMVGLFKLHKQDMFEVSIPQNTQYIITNPPWDRGILHKMLEQFPKKVGMWLLFDADWIHTKQSIQFQHMLKSIVSIGRVKWIADSKSVGKDNCAWYYFDDRPEWQQEDVKIKNGAINFYGKRENKTR